MADYPVGPPSAFPEGDGVPVEVDGRAIAVFRIDDEFYAVQNRCPHKGGPLYQGEIDEEACSVYCPWHTWEWNLETGEFAVDPRKRVRTFDVAVRDGSVVVEL